MICSMQVDREVLALSPRSVNRVATLPLQPTRHVSCVIRLQVSTCRYCVLVAASTHDIVCFECRLT